MTSTHDDFGPEKSEKIDPDPSKEDESKKAGWVKSLTILEQAGVDIDPTKLPELTPEQKNLLQDPTMQSFLLKLFAGEFSVDRKKRRSPRRDEDGHQR